VSGPYDDDPCFDCDDAGTDVCEDCPDQMIRKEDTE
jgi:hypothetical protein